MGTQHGTNAGDGPVVHGIVLAAGHSTRMGEPKAQLDLHGESFMERAVHALHRGGCRYILAVVNDQDDWTIRLADVAGAGVLMNRAEESQQIDSLRIALDEIAALPEPADAVVVLPVDRPLVQEATVAAVIRAFAERGAPIVRAAHRETPGHPVLFARPLFDELRHGAYPQGAESVIAAHIAEVEDVEVDDRGVIVNIDTPEEYREHTEG